MNSLPFFNYAKPSKLLQGNDDDNDDDEDEDEKENVSITIVTHIFHSVIVSTALPGNETISFIAIKVQLL